MSHSFGHIVLYLFPRLLNLILTSVNIRTLSPLASRFNLFFPPVMFVFSWFSPHIFFAFLWVGEFFFFCRYGFLSFGHAFFFCPLPFPPTYCASLLISGPLCVFVRLLNVSIIVFHRVLQECCRPPPPTISFHGTTSCHPYFLCFFHFCDGLLFSSFVALRCKYYLSFFTPFAHPMDPFFDKFFFPWWLFLNVIEAFILFFPPRSVLPSPLYFTPRLSYLGLHFLHLLPGRGDFVPRMINMVFPPFG